MDSDEGSRDQVADQLVNMIIRPPRAKYCIQQLGPPKFQLGNWKIVRKDFQITNKRGMRLECSHFEPVPRPTERLPCVLYLHGNASCRVEALSVSSLILSSGISLFAVDLSGSGMSEGKYISLGVYEKDDVVAVVDYLRSEGHTSKIVLWGRSMGAATALMYCGDTKVDEMVVGMILDSPFASLNELAHDIVGKFQLPLLAQKALMVYGMRKAESVLIEKMNFQIADLEPIRSARNCHLPALFIHGEGDDFIPPKHSQMIYKEYGFDEKRLILVEGTHDGERPQWGRDHAYAFLQHKLIAGTELTLQGSQKTTIKPISLPEVWKERGNQFVRDKGDWKGAREWYSRSIQFLIEEVEAGRLEAMGCDIGGGKDDDSFIQWWFGLFCGRPQDSPARPQKPILTETDRFLAVLYSNLSLCCMKEEDAAAALDASSKSLRHNPDFVRAYFRKCTAHMILEQYESARLTAEEGLVLDPGNPDLLLLRSRLLSHLPSKQLKESVLMDERKAGSQMRGVPPLNRDFRREQENGEEENDEERGFEIVDGGDGGEEERSFERIGKEEEEDESFHLQSDAHLTREELSEIAMQLFERGDETQKTAAEEEA